MLYFSHFYQRVTSNFIQRVRVGKWLGVCGLSLAICVSSKPVSIGAEELPALGDGVSGVISWEREAELGENLFRLLKSSVPVIEDPGLNEYMEHLVYELASVSELEAPNTLHIAVINSPDINAFAMPGGVIGINAGLFLHSESEDELAAVVAHELAHLSQRHFARALDRSKQSKWAGLTAVIASIAIAATTGSSDAGVAALAATQAASLQSQLRFSRQNEYEADRIGIITLQRAGFDPSAMPRFFSRLASTQRFSAANQYEFLRTHPVTQARLSDSQARAQQMNQSNSGSPTETRIEDLEFYLMKSKLQVAYAPSGRDAVNTFTAQLDKTLPTQAPALGYGLALAHARAFDYEASNIILRTLLKQDPHRVTYLVSLTENLIKNDQAEQAVALLERAIALNPEHFALTIGLGKALVQTESGEKAVRILRNAITDRPDSYLTWSLLRTAYNLTKNQVGVHLANAELKYLAGQHNHAIDQAELALNLVPDDDLLMTEKIQTRINAFRLAQAPISL